MLDKSFATVCSVAAEREGNQVSRGNGVFLSPTRVLTSWHIIAGAKSLKFTNIMGQTSTMKPAREGGQHFVDKELDVALVEMKRPIANDFALPPRGLPPLKSIFDDANAVMKTRYDEKPAMHRVVCCSTPGGVNGKDTTMTLHTGFETKQGYSGSPVFADDGCTLISILYGHAPEAVRQAKEFGDIMGGLSRKPPAARCDIPFLVVHPQRLAAWYKKVEMELGLA